MAQSALLSMLGAQNEAEAIQLVQGFNSFLSDARSATGAKDHDEALRAIQTHASHIRQIASLTGKSGDEALGVLMAWKESHEKVAELQAQVADLQKAESGHELDRAIADAKEKGKLTPAEEKSYREKVTAGELSVATAKALLEAKPTIPALANKEGQRPSGSNENANNDGKLTHNGKTWDELKPAERAALKRENAELYGAMRKGAGLE